MNYFHVFDILLTIKIRRYRKGTIFEYIKAEGIFMMNNVKKKIIISVENAIISLDILNTLRKKGFTTEKVKIRQLNQIYPDLIITDNIESFRKCKKIPIIYLADENSVNIDYEQFIVLEEPFVTQDLIQAVNNCL